MNKQPTSRKFRYAIIGSVLLNIFLLALVLGRLTMSPHAPPPKGAMALPGIVKGVRTHRRMEPEGMETPQPLPLPPPFFISPADLYTPEEIQADFAQTQQNIEKTGDLRKELAARLKQGAMSKEELLRYFDQMDQLMDSQREATQNLVAEKISALPEDDRIRLAEKLELDRVPGPSAAPVSWPSRPISGEPMPHEQFDEDGMPIIMEE